MACLMVMCILSGCIETGDSGQLGESVDDDMTLPEWEVGNNWLYTFITPQFGEDSARLVVAEIDNESGDYQVGISSEREAQRHAVINHNPFLGRMTIDGLSVYAAIGENNNAANSADLSMFGVKYAMGAITIGFQVNETDYGSGSSDEDFTAIGVSYAVSDDLSVSYNQSTIDYEVSTKEDQEATGVSFSYTSGGLTVSATHSTIDNVAGTSTADNSGYEVNFVFAF